MFLQNAEPGCRGGAEDGAAVENHSSCAGDVVVGKAAPVDELLRGDVAYAEEDGCGDGLG